MSILKRILAVITGVFVGLCFVMVGDLGSSMVAPSLKTMDPSNREQMIEVMARIPLYAFLVMLAGYIIGAFVGGLLATLIAGEGMSRPAIMVGIILTMGNIWNQMELPHPLWFAIISTLLYIPMAWLGFRVLKPKETV